MKVTMKGRLYVLMAVLVGFVVISSVVVPTSVLAQDGDENETEYTGESGYTLSELRDLGDRRSGANVPNSMRPYGDAGGFWVRHVPTSSVGIQDTEENRRYVTPKTTVTRTHIYVGSFRGWNADKMNASLRVVAWKVGSRQVSEGNTTRTVRVPQNVTETTVNATFAAGTYDETEVELPPLFEDDGGAYYLTMWVEGHKGELQWVFKYAPNRGAATVPATSVAGRVAWAGWNIGFTGLATAGFALWTDQKLLRKMRTGPRVSPLEYAFVGGILTIMLGFVFWNGVADVLAHEPWLLGVVIGLAIGVLGLYFMSPETKRILLIQLRSTDGKMDDGGFGSWYVPNRALEVVTSSDGKVHVPRQGWLPALARAWPFHDVTPELTFDGDKARSLPATAENMERAVSSAEDAATGPDPLAPGIPAGEETPASDEQGRLSRAQSRASGAWGRIRTRFTSPDESGDTSDFHEIYFVDPDAEHVVEHDRETFTLEFPSFFTPRPDDADPEGAGIVDLISRFRAGRFVAMVAFLGFAFVGTSAVLHSSTLGWLATFAAMAALSVRPVGGDAFVDLAPVHYTPVVAAMLKHVEGWTDAADSEYWQAKFINAEATRRADRKTERESRETSTFNAVLENLAPEDGDRETDPRRGPKESEVSADD